MIDCQAPGIDPARLGDGERRETVGQDETDTLDVRFCEKHGERGITAFWKAGKLIEVEVAPRTGDPENRFVGYMNAPQ